MRIEQLQMELNQRQTRSAMLPLLPKLLNAIWARGCPRVVVTIAIASGPMQNAIVIITAHPLNKAVTSEETIAKGTALAAFEASSAMAAADSKPETTQTGVKKHIINAHPLLLQKPVFSKSTNTKLAVFFSSLGVPAANAMMNARSIANCTPMYIILSLWSNSVVTQVMAKVSRVVATNIPY